MDCLLFLEGLMVFAVGMFSLLVKVLIIILLN